MSWGERSCRHYGYCPIKDECTQSTCNVDCRKYERNPEIEPDSRPKVPKIHIGDPPAMMDGPTTISSVLIDENPDLSPEDLEALLDKMKTAPRNPNINFFQLGRTHDRTEAKAAFAVVEALKGGPTDPNIEMLRGLPRLPYQGGDPPKPKKFKKRKRR